MSRRAELSPNRVDREWPHQIALKANDCLGWTDTAMRAFCSDLSLCPRGHSYVDNDERMRVFCFAEKAHAEKFETQFGGAWFDRFAHPTGHYRPCVAPTHGNSCVWR